MAGARNCVLNATEASVYQAVKVVADPGLPPNAGYFRAIEVRVPPGSVLNCRSPAAVGDRSPTTNMLGDLLHGALFEAVPERVMAGCGPRQGIIFSGFDDRRGAYFVDYEIFAGGSGALFDQDGKDAVRVHATIANSTPTEATEQEFPLIVRRSELVPDSGGAGKFRGGLAMRTDIAAWGEEPRVSGRGMRQTMPAEGLNGGGSGASGRFLLHPKTIGSAASPACSRSFRSYPGRRSEWKRRALRATATPCNGTPRSCWPTFAPARSARRRRGNAMAWHWRAAESTPRGPRR